MKILIHVHGSSHKNFQDSDKKFLDKEKMGGGY